MGVTERRGMGVTVKTVTGDDREHRLTEGSRSKAWCRSCHALPRHYTCTRTYLRHETKSGSVPLIVVMCNIGFSAVHTMASLNCAALR